MDKIALRAQALTARRDAALSAPDAAERLILHWPPTVRPRVLALYRPIRGELDPLPLARALGAATALPVTPPRGSDAPLSFRLWREGERLARSAFGTIEPPETAPPTTPDVVLTPLLAFNADGHRLGWGQGHYDRTLAALRARGSPVAIGVAYAAQRRDDLPVEAHDQPLDGVLTETAYIAVSDKAT